MRLILSDIVKSGTLGLTSMHMSPFKMSEMKYRNSRHP